MLWQTIRGSFRVNKSRLLKYRIATKLFVSTHTVKAHSESIYYKIGARNRVEATRLYLTKEIKNML